ncbi:MAG: terminase [Gammaproteobacteria bacterium]|nr:terminase [Gammaproteobacteria bacterium]
MTFISPARLHKQRIAAEQAAKQSATEPSSEYQLGLATLDQQRRALSGVQSRETQQGMKKEYLATWQGYIDTTLAENTGKKDDPIISRIWVWLMDTGDFDQAIAVGKYMLDNDINPPESFNRSTATTFAEEMAEAWLKPHGKRTITADHLIETLDIVKDCDVFDEVMAKLYRATAESLGTQQQGGDDETTLGLYNRALELNPKVGCKKARDEIEKRLTKQ